ncbi:hypothetical protein D3C81_1645770 [compost metagenome]
MRGGYVASLCFDRRLCAANEAVVSDHDVSIRAVLQYGDSVTVLCWCDVSEQAVFDKDILCWTCIIPIKVDVYASRYSRCRDLVEGTADDLTEVAARRYKHSANVVHAAVSDVLESQALQHEVRAVLDVESPQRGVASVERNARHDEVRTVGNFKHRTAADRLQGSVACDDYFLAVDDNWTDYVIRFTDHENGGSRRRKSSNLLIQ